jgi:hypothetical protein
MMAASSSKRLKDELKSLTLDMDVSQIEAISRRIWAHFKAGQISGELANAIRSATTVARSCVNRFVEV